MNKIFSMKIENCEKCMFHTRTVLPQDSGDSVHFRSCLHRDSIQTKIDLRTFKNGFPSTCPLPNECHFKLIVNKQKETPWVAG